MACKSYTLYITTMETDLNSLLAFVKTHEGFEGARLDNAVSGGFGTGTWAIWCSIQKHFQDEFTNEWESYLAYTRIGSTMKEVRETLGY